MFVSIIVCTHSLDNLENLKDAVDSLLNQTHQRKETIVIVDGNQELYDEIAKAYGGQENVEVVPLKNNIGLSRARNAGIRVAQGDVIAFFDDDAVAEKRWLESLVNVYEERNAIAVGGKILPIWLAHRPDYLPEELDWLVGITHEGFAEEKVIEVRNTFGPNMSFRREVFEEVGLFNERFGFGERGMSYMQGEEAELTLRMSRKFGKGVIYNPEAIVYHKISPSKVRPAVLLRRAFYQGCSKALLKRLSPAPEALTAEGAYLKDLLFKYIPRRAKRMEIRKLCFLLAAIICVGLGFAYAYVKR